MYPREKARIPTRVPCLEKKFQSKVVVSNPISLNRSHPGDTAQFPLRFANIRRYCNISHRDLPYAGKWILVGVAFLDKQPLLLREKELLSTRL